MMRNDYRRALILLRSNAPGYSGHVRLERRTLMGSMYFQTQIPAECTALRAVLAGRGRDGYYACALGDLPRDGRGQASLSYSFDPRNICGHELEDYQLLVLTCAEDENCEIVLYGNVCGHANLNWEQVHAVVCGLYKDSAVTLPLHSGETSDVQHFDADSEENNAEFGQEQEVTTESNSENASEVQTETREMPILSEKNGQKAMELLDLNPALPWPEDVEPLRTLFLYSPPLENPPDEECVYIAAPMPEESGYPYVAVGIRAENGEPVLVRYALPDKWSAEAPAGLEEYTWVGNGNTGWWVSETDI